MKHGEISKEIYKAAISITVSRNFTGNGLRALDPFNLPPEAQTKSETADFTYQGISVFL